MIQRPEITSPFLVLCEMHLFYTSHSLWLWRLWKADACLPMTREEWKLKEGDQLISTNSRIESRAVNHLSSPSIPFTLFLNVLFLYRSCNLLSFHSFHFSHLYPLPTVFCVPSFLNCARIVIICKCYYQFTFGGCVSWKPESSVTKACLPLNSISSIVQGTGFIIATIYKKKLILFWQQLWNISVLQLYSPFLMTEISWAGGKGYSELFNNHLLVRLGHCGLDLSLPWLWVCYSDS